MLNIKRLTVNPLQENCYIVSDEMQECVIIDCGAQSTGEHNAILDYIKQNNLKPVRLLLTHGHIDHCMGNGFIHKEFGLKPEVHLKEQALIEQLNEQNEYIVGQPLKDELPPVGRYFTGNDTIKFGSHEFTIIETPGHSPGSVFFYCEAEKTAFSGDTLFCGSIGRTDLWGGSMFQIIQSLRMICQLPDDVKIYPGHGPETTIGYECATNTYLDR